MSVDVQCEGGRGVTQQILDALDVRPGGNGYGGGSVPQIVRASGLPMLAAIRLNFP